MERQKEPWIEENRCQPGRTEKNGLRAISCLFWRVFLLSLVLCLSFAAWLSSLQPGNFSSRWYAQPITQSLEHILLENAKGGYQVPLSKLHWHVSAVQRRKFWQEDVAATVSEVLLPQTVQAQARVAMCPSLLSSKWA